MLTKNVILFDDSQRDQLLPLTFTRPVAELRVGITTIKEKWELLLGTKVSYHTQEYLSGKFPLKAGSDNFFINGAVIPSEIILKQIEDLKTGESLIGKGIIIAYRSPGPIPFDQYDRLQSNNYTNDFLCIRHLWDLFLLNNTILCDDYRRITAGRVSQPLSNTNTVLGRENIFLEEGAKVEMAILNANSGPIYVGRDAEIMEGSVVRGPLAMCEHSALKMGAKIYGATTLGPHSKVGGEVNNSIFTGYSNKAHDGFLGNSVLGEWCNLGAGTNNSNLKNSYAKVKLWNYPKNKFEQTGEQFCGLFMGDHSKAAINTMFNTGTIVGVSSNVFGSGFPRNFIPSFSWGGAGGFMVYKTDKAIETAEIVLSRRDLKLTEHERAIFHHIYTLTEKYRNF